MESKERSDAPDQALSWYTDGEKYFLATDANEIFVYHKDTVQFTKEGKTLIAHYFDGDGEPLLDVDYPKHELKGRIAFKVDDHVPNFKLTVTYNYIQRESDAEAVQNASNCTPVVPPSGKAGWDKAVIPETDSDPQASTIDPQDQELEATEYFADDEADRYEAIKTMAYIQVNFKAFVNANFIDCRPGVSLASVKEDYLAALPTKIQAKITTLKEEGRESILFELKLKQEFINACRVRAGVVPCFQRWRSAVPQEEGDVSTVMAILEGNEDITPRLEILTNILKHLQSESIGASRNLGSLSRFFKELGKVRPVYYKKYMIAKPRRYDTNPQDYKYAERTNFFNMEEYLTVQAIFAISERDREAQHTAAFCNVEHTLRLLPIPHAGNRAYIGYLERPGESLLRVTGCMQFAIVFRSQYEAEQPGKWHGTVSAEHITVGPVSYIKLLINRPWNKATAKFSEQNFTPYSQNLLWI